MSSEYTVKLATFEGPLDLLLHLIKVNELEITEIAISEITSQYLEYLRLMERLDLEVAGDFLVMAASLLNIKLRTLLPEPEAEEGDEGAEEPDDFMSARALMQQLIEYRRFKEAALNLGVRGERQSQIFVREVALPTISEAENDPLVKGDLNRLLEAFTRVLRFVERRNYHEVRPEEFTIDDKMRILRRRLLIEERIGLDELFGECRAKIEMIVTLIALLELCRMKELRVHQLENFDQVFIARAERAIDAGPIDPVADQAAELERIEAEILANRTGVVDDGELPEEDEDDALPEGLDLPPDLPSLDEKLAALPVISGEVNEAAELDPALETEPVGTEPPGVEPINVASVQVLPRAWERAEIEPVGEDAAGAQDAVERASGDDAPAAEEPDAAPADTARVIDIHQGIPETEPYEAEPPDAEPPRPEPDPELPDEEPQ